VNSPEHEISGGKQVIPFVGRRERLQRVRPDTVIPLSDHYLITVSHIAASI
jgi:hypothetical protein